MIRPTRRAALLFGLIQAPALVLMAMKEQFWPASVGAAILVLLLIGLDALLGVPAHRLAVSAATHPRQPVGGAGELVVAVTGPQHAPSTRFEFMVEATGDVNALTPGFATAESGGEATASLPLAFPRRGRADIRALWLKWRGPLGLCERIHRVALDLPIEILPDVRGVRAVALQYNARESLYGIKAQKQKGEGAEFESLRDHAPGLDNRLIDWKRSARHHRLVSKEFRSERNHRVILAFDTGHLMVEPIDGVARLDHAINAGLLLSYVCLRSGDLVGVYGFDARIRRYVEPGRGLAWFQKLQRGAGALAYESVETNFTLGLTELNTRLNRRALVILFTEFIDSTSAELLIESLRSMANRHAVLFVTFRDAELDALADAPPDDFDAAAKAVVAKDFLREKAIVMERLERLGVHCLDTSVRGLSTHLINRYLSLKERGLA